MVASAAGSADESISRAERFGHLLQPIRDLAENWNINVASELEEYLNELAPRPDVGTQIEGVKFAFDGNGETFNFAEAALLIQGSACIYSKKVEYLYSLVYETLDLLASKRKLAQTTSLNEDGTDQDASSFADDDEDAFLSLDDIKTETNIDMKEQRLVVTNDGDTLIPRTPVALIPLSEQERAGDAQLISVQGAVIGNRSDFKMNTSIVHESGALLLGVDDSRLVDHSFRAPASRTPGRSVTFAENVEEAMELDDNHSDNGNDYDNGDDYNFEDDFNQMQEQQAQQHSPKQTNPLPWESQKHDAVEDVPAANPWAQLDPHSTDSSHTVNPFRHIKKFRVPSSLVPTKKGKKKKSAPPLPPISRFCEEQMLKLSTRSLPRAPLRAPEYTEFQEAFWKEQKRRAEARKQDRKQLLRITTAHPQEYTATPTAKRAIDPQELSQTVIGGLGEDGEGDYPDNEYDFGGTDNYDENYMLEEVAAEPVAPVAFNVDDDLTAAAATMPYEDLVRRHIERYVSEVDRYALETDLTKRVKDWEARIRPVLEEEERHPEFDIFQYGTEVLDGFDKKISERNCVQPFAKVARTSQKFQVCRMFLATLQLANMGNIEIMNPEDGSTVDHLKIKILTRRRVQQEGIADFFA